MKNEGITQGPLFAVQDSVGAWCVNVGNSQFDQQVAYVGSDNPHVETGSAKGNAQLFAAAPEMLAAMKTAEYMMEATLTGVWTPNHIASFKTAIAALNQSIAKAEGRA